MYPLGPVGTGCVELGKRLESQVCAFLPFCLEVIEEMPGVT